MAGWKFCFDTDLSAIPAAISVPCYRYGDGRMFSLIIGNCEPVSIPVHRYTYSYFNNTCQKSCCLQTWWSQQLLRGNTESYFWSCTYTDTQPHTDDEWSRQCSQHIRSRTLHDLKEKTLLCHCLHLTKQNLTYAQWNSGEVREREEQISDIVHRGMFEDLHLMLSPLTDGISPWSHPGRCATGKEAWSLL